MFTGKDELADPTVRYGVARAIIIKAVAPLAAQDGFERAWLIIYASMDNFTAAGTCSRSKAVSFVQNERNKSIAREFSGNGQADHPSRSEEHTSELQSLMRNSSAVFCLKKKKHKINNINNNKSQT